MSKSFKTPDVRELKDEKFPDAEFPAPRGGDFRVYFSPGTHAEILRHAGEDTSVEICGVLVGGWQRDADGPFVEISNHIRADSAASKFAEVTFTHESWSKINEVMDEKYSDLTIVGWYHSHPDFGIFLSDRDVFIQENFFSGPGQIAHVVDPIRKTEGVFVWRGGKPKLCSHYWIGETITAGAEGGSKRERTSNTTPASEAAAAANVQAAPLATRPPLPFWVTALNYVLVFLIGYMFSGMLTRGRAAWEQEAMFDRMMQEYAMFNVMRPGLRDEMRLVDKHLKAITQQMSVLAKEHVALTEEEEAAKEKTEEWKKLVDALQAVRKQVATVDRRFGFSEQEQAAIERYVAAAKAAREAKQKMRIEQLKKLQKEIEGDEGGGKEKAEKEDNGDSEKKNPKQEKPKEPKEEDKPKPKQPPLEDTKPKEPAKEDQPAEKDPPKEPADKSKASEENGDTEKTPKEEPKADSGEPKE